MASPEIDPSAGLPGRHHDDRGDPSFGKVAAGPDSEGVLQSPRWRRSSGIAARAKSWLLTRARTVHRRLAPELTPHAKVLTAVVFVGDQQVRAHRVTSKVNLFAREGGLACGWDEGEPKLIGGSVSYVSAPIAASGIHPLFGYDRATRPRRGDHNVLHPNSYVPHVETSRARRGVMHLVSVSLARPTLLLSRLDAGSATRPGSSSCCWSRRRRPLGRVLERKAQREKGA